MILVLISYNTEVKDHSIHVQYFAVIRYTSPHDPMSSLLQCLQYISMTLDRKIFFDWLSNALSTFVLMD